MGHSSPSSKDDAAASTNVRRHLTLRGAVSSEGEELAAEEPVLANHHPERNTMTVNIGKAFPQSYDALLGLNTLAETAAADSGLDPLLIELVKIRVSQLNGCAFCLRMHTRDALKHGETTDRLAVVAAWWETQYFSEPEQAALGLAEHITRIGEAHWSSEKGAEGGVLTDSQTAAITWLAIVMNAWNRLAISSHYPVGA
jgi:AhpD family alkylhydroperoxidase